MTDNLRITTIQTNLFWEDKDKNISNLEQKIHNINDETDIIVLPEMFSTGFSMSPEMLAETMEGHTVQWMKKMAFSKSVLLIGSVIIKENEKYFNRLLAVYPTGNIEYYDKRHLFTPGGEHGKYSRGSKVLIIKYKGWRINPLICYDLRFPVWSRSRLNYDIQIYVANWPQKRHNHWTTLLQARSIENQAYVVGVNRIGVDGKGYEHSGDTAVFDPWGEKISSTKANEEKNETLVLKKDTLLKVRKFLPTLNDADEFKIKDLDY